MKTDAQIFHDDEDSLLIGSSLERRVAAVSAEQTTAVEAFVFGAAQRRLGKAESELDRHLNARVDELIASGIPGGNCINIARADDTERALAARARPRPPRRRGDLDSRRHRPPRSLRDRRAPFAPTVPERAGAPSGLTSR